MSQQGGERVRVRRGRTSDRERIVGLIPELYAFGPPAWREPAVMEVRDRRVIEDALGGRTLGALVLVAESSAGEFLGFVHLCERDDYYAGPTGHIADLVVAPSARGRGVGKRLLSEAERWARASGYSLLTLNVFVANERAARVYRASGFSAEVTRFVKPLAPADE